MKFKGWGGSWKVEEPSLEKDNGNREEDFNKEGEEAHLISKSGFSFCS